METIKTILAVGVLAVLFGVLFSVGVKKTERLECKQWIVDSKIYAGWYATDWQIKQCKNYGVELLR